ncbi:receptor-like protein kinase [Gossypium australe]|uniref:Receptor-like protein kinase n=1 Tax=Gossypium australe TaxID=47621 RepID=A0A5B6WU07_9ROSI|nr:receptor-like protein kinase [Gossypium australe]
MTYRLAFPPKIEEIHNVFHISMLRQYISNPSHVITPSEIELELDLLYSEEQVRILAREVKELCNNIVSPTRYRRSYMGNERFDEISLPESILRW